MHHSIIYLFYVCIFCALLATSVLILMEKWKIREYFYHLKSTRVLFSHFPVECDFCLSFWISTFLVVGLMIRGYLDFELIVILVPFASAALSQKLLR